MTHRIAKLLITLLVVAGCNVWAPLAWSDEQRDYLIQPVPFNQVRVGGEFWGPRIITNRETTLPYTFRKCEETERIANFARAGGLEPGKFVGIFFNDSDVYKVIEGAAYVLSIHPDAKLDAYLDQVIAKIAAAQEKDGYLYTARTLGAVNAATGPQRWSNLGSSHELYNAGHLYEAAVAHWRATGKRSLLDVAIKNADLICRTFGPGEGQRVAVPGHEEIEIGLVRLYRATHEKRYLDTAKFFVDMRGRSDRRKLYGAYAQDHQPIVEQTEAVGHAVRGGYLYAGVADIAAITDDKDYIQAIDRIWKDVVDRKLYLIGNVGQHGAGEGYAGPYKLSNLRAYNETCAAIALALWNHRMFLLHGDAKYIDVLERTIYNAFLAGVSLSGDRFFYPNPLACDLHFKFNHGALTRSPWFNCSCCPVNVVRFIPSIPGYVYAVRDDSVYVNLYIAGEGKVDVAGQSVTIKQETRYPWDGAIKITVTPKHAGKFALRLRTPGWLTRPIPSDLYRYLPGKPDGVQLLINGKPAGVAHEKGYAVIHRLWKAGDVVEQHFPMPVRRVLSHNNIKDNRGRVAVERGPIVYCVEGADHEGKVLDLYLEDNVELTPQHRPDLLGGVTVLTGQASRVYRGKDNKVTSRPEKITMIPYYAWCHRGANEMAVWLPRDASTVRLPPAPTVASQARASASHVWAGDTVDALNDQIEPASSIDHSIARFTWWDHRGGVEWVQYDLAARATVSGVEVYWFDDTGRGQCRVPARWRVLYRAGDTWKPVELLDGQRYGVKRDQFNAVQFKPVTTSALRIEATLQDKFSAGILEWKVREPS